MDRRNTVERPKACEKLSHKFILDALRDQGGVTSAKDPQHENENDGGPVDWASQRAFELAEERPLQNTPYHPLELPTEKKYFRIGEVAEIVGVEPYVLRYWESEFPMVRPQKSGSGQRVYSRKDVDTLRKIKHLLHTEKFSIKGAKKQMRANRAQISTDCEPTLRRNQEVLRELVTEIKELIQVSKNNPGMM